MKTKFYEISQNNSGGSFTLDDKLCHRLFIEADSSDEAASIAENLGCYWDGCETGQDCSCCGDRWYRPWNSDGINLDEINTKRNGYEISMWVNKEIQTPDELMSDVKSRYSDMTWLEDPKIESEYGSKRVVGRVKVDNIEQYSQILADLYGWTLPDVRIFYKNGEVKEIFSNKLK
jgi:hypothetical protein